VAAVFARFSREPPATDARGSVATTGASRAPRTKPQRNAWTSRYQEPPPAPLGPTIPTRRYPRAGPAPGPAHAALESPEKQHQRHDEARLPRCRIPTNGAPNAQQRGTGAIWHLTDGRPRDSRREASHQIDGLDSAKWLHSEHGTPARQTRAATASDPHTRPRCALSLTAPDESRTAERVARLTAMRRYQRPRGRQPKRKPRRSPVGTCAQGTRARGTSAHRWGQARTPLWTARANRFALGPTTGAPAPNRGRSARTEHDRKVRGACRGA